MALIFTGCVGLISAIGVKIARNNATKKVYNSIIKDTHHRFDIKIGSGLRSTSELRTTSGIGSEVSCTTKLLDTTRLLDESEKYDFPFNTLFVTLHGIENGEKLKNIPKKSRENYGLNVIKYSKYKTYNIYEDPLINIDESKSDPNKIFLGQYIVRRDNTGTLKIANDIIEPNSPYNRAQLMNQCYKYSSTFSVDHMKKIFDRFQEPLPIDPYTKKEYPFYEIKYQPYVDKDLVAYNYEAKSLIGENIEQIAKALTSYHYHDHLINPLFIWSGVMILSGGIIDYGSYLSNLF